MREFASFTPAESRYIKRSLGVAGGSPGVEKVWGRTNGESASIAAQRAVYSALPRLRELVREGASHDPLQSFMPGLMTLTRFDLLQGSLTCFSAYRFLYERLLGSSARPWLPGAFCGVSAMPDFIPERRKQLLQSISEAAATAPGWSKARPFFFPEWVSKE